jgi:diguanylate cyclase (GGDEF)-like protein
VASLGLAVFGERAARRAQKRLSHLASHDNLTALPNRVALEAALDELASTRRSAGQAAVIIVELDHFDAVNQTSGHEIGDHLMIQAADHLKSALLPGESLYRLGGPLFVVLAPQAITREAAEGRAETFQHAVRVQYRVDHDHLKISASAGIVMLDQRHRGAAVIVDDLTAAVRAAGDLGPQSTAVFELSMRDAIADDDVERRLREAFDRQEFLLMYMPIVRISDGRLMGVEALLRWADPSRGVMHAAQFLDLVERAGILSPVGDWTITEACRHNRSWQDRFPDEDLATTVNVAPRQLADLDFPETLQRIMAETGVDPNRLCLELTGAPHPDEIDLIWRNLRLVKDLGVQVALDDFGVGFATFDFVRRFALDILKIDRSLVERVADSDPDAAIVQQLVMMARELDLVTIAEGVDSAEQAAAMSSFGCELGQGHYWSQAVSLDSIEKLIERRTIRPSANRARRIDWKAPAPAAPAQPVARRRS